jgi:hypothetical protein
MKTSTHLKIFAQISGRDFLILILVVYYAAYQACDPYL